jgi:hypothetical protein
VAEVNAAVASGDVASLLMSLSKGLIDGQPDLSKQLAGAAIEKNMRELPGIGPERLHAIVIGGSAGTEVLGVGNLRLLADNLRRAAEMWQIAFPVLTSRQPGRRLEDSTTRAVTRAGRLADELDALARGEFVVLRDVVNELNFFGRTDVTLALSRLTRFDDGVSPLDVANGAWLRRNVSPAAGLAHQRRLLELDPYNTAARNSACGCLVDLGRAREGVADLAFSLLLRPDHHTGNTATRTLLAADCPSLVGCAKFIADTMDGQPAFPTPPSVRAAADRILDVIGYPTIRSADVVTVTEKLLLAAGGAR